jgi:2-polyprenyl-6-methoxyphenol hydroxylase-like FAD-dependent oxidoreductase
MSSIGIVGAGVAGLHLGLFLQQQGIEATIYAERSPAQQLGGQLPSLVARHDHTRERERLLGVNHWDAAESNLRRVYVDVIGEQSLRFHGDLERPAIVVDMRIYCARLLEDFASRGGKVVVGGLEPADVERLSTEHDLMVVATGRGGLNNMFPRRPEHSPYTGPQRMIVTGLFRGVDYLRPEGGNFVIVPGHGEIFALPVYSFEPGLIGLGVEIIPGGGLEPILKTASAETPREFEQTVIELMRQYAPMIAERIDPAAFRLTRPLDLMKGSITPTVRRGYARLGNGRLAMALGDTHVLNDPILGQGANTASYAAWQLGEAIRDADSFDEAFCQDVERRIWEYAQPVTEWNNAMLQPPPEHMIEFLVAASLVQPIADTFAGFLNDPRRGWETLSSPTNTAALLRRFGWQGMPAPLAA